MATADDTHYTTLGVTQAAEVSVIRAAYRALALLHHPDKTVHLSAEDRAAHSAIFRKVQEAYDVLSNPSLKVAYDRELKRHGNRVDSSLSTFHQSTPATSSRRRNVVHVTSPEEKRAMKAQIEQDIAYLREQRGRQDLKDSELDIDGLKFMLRVWVEMASEYNDDVEGQGHLRAHCAVQVQVYQAKIAKREREHKDWLENMSRPKTAAAPGAKHDTRTNPSHPATPTPSKPRPTMPFPKPTSRAGPKHTTANASTMRPLQTEEKKRKEAAKQAHQNSKANAVRAEKEKYKAKVQEQARQEEARIARARVKAGASVLGQRAGTSATTPNHTGTSQQHAESKKTSGNKPCSTCGGSHASLAEFRKCVRERKNEVSDESFFQTV